MTNAPADRTAWSYFVASRGGDARAVSGLFWDVYGVDEMCCDTLVLQRFMSDFDMPQGFNLV